MPTRFQEPHRWPALWPMLVRCPRCGGRASAVRGDDRQVRVTCGACGFAANGEAAGLRDGTLNLVEPGTRARRWPRGARGRQAREERSRAYELWMRTECCGGRVLWATNPEHLTYLEEYVAAGLRERPAAPRSVAGLSWRLPSWMKDAKHREEVVRNLGRLRATL